MKVIIIMADTDWTSPTTIASIATAVITIAGWIITAGLAKRNTTTDSKNSELNQLIDNLDVLLESIYSRMVRLLASDADDNKLAYYHEFISSMAKVRFLCQSIQKIDKNQIIDYDAIGVLRQACTDDNNYNKQKLPQVLAQVQTAHQGLRDKYTKKFK